MVESCEVASILPAEGCPWALQCPAPPAVALSNSEKSHFRGFFPNLKVFAVISDFGSQSRRSSFLWGSGMPPVYCTTLLAGYGVFLMIKCTGLYIRSLLF
jgi:hypothetical protein